MVAQTLKKYQKELLLFGNYAMIVLTLGISYFLSTLGADFLTHSTGGHASNIPLIFDVLAILILGFVGYELSKKTVIPSFVLAVLYGMMTKEILILVTGNIEALSVLTTIGAAYILFGGGLEMPFKRFKSLIGPILSIAIFGTMISALLFSLYLQWTSAWFALDWPIVSMVLLGVALASTDPAAIIPCFKSLNFLQPKVKLIAISESALNDVVGALLTVVLMTLLLGKSQLATPLTNVWQAYSLLFDWQNLWTIAVTVLVSLLAGYLGYLILLIWSKWKERSYSVGEADAALFLAIPLLSFALASLFGGNGFLAVFVTGLLFHLGYHVEHVEHFFNHSIEGLMKPMIFMFLGAMVDLESLWKFALPGLAAALVFMFIIRPIVVLVTMLPFYFNQKAGLNWRELAFLSFVRETGVIPAVLLVTLSAAEVPHSETVVAIGMWIILATLIIEPPLTPFLAKWLKIADIASGVEKDHQISGPMAVICSRGKSFLKRIDFVTDWALKHKVKNVALLHCPEDRYSENFVAQVEQLAQNKFAELNQKLLDNGDKALHFEVLSRKGNLEENIRSLISEEQVSIVFVGVKMLDFRIEEVKELEVPFYFMA